MSFRNLSPQHLFEQLAAAHVPQRTFTGASLSDFESWKQATLAEVLATLGWSPQPVAANPRLLGEWHHDGLRKQKWLIDVQEHISATLLINYPERASEADRLPALLCWHGHGAFGKDPVMGNDSSPEMRDSISRMNYSYGHQMAKAGYVTFAIDWIGCGERNDNRKPNNNNQNKQRDWCNLYYLHATMLGTTSIAINVAHGRAATDFVCEQPFVDPARLGVMGLSGGGTMTLWSALCDQRFRAAEIICYSGLWPHFGTRDANYCGMQVSPGLFQLVHLHDLQGLLAPKPLLIDIGAYDTCFAIDESLACYRGVEKIYTAAGWGDRLELDLFPGAHGWGGNRSKAFFAAHLA